MLDQPIARGKKQRIKKKIQSLKNPNGVNGEKQTTSTNLDEGDKLDAKQRVEQLLKKRDEKLLRKEQQKMAGKHYQTQEDKDIVRQ